ncbi:MAG TPA: hypothetical protein VKA53_10735, partial [Thermoanaerobaculia bacterium]|nr:hypothetical protein [Thermoanaerobaculia bacterium]
MRASRLLIALSLSATLASPVAGTSERIAQDRPESWALNYFTATSLMSGFGAPKAAEPGTVSLGVEATLIPRLGVRQRTVGFNGTKTEDLNKLPILARPRLEIGLPWRLTVTLGYVPPVSLSGVRPNLFSFSLGRPWLERDPWRLGARLTGLWGGVDGDFTCSAEQAAAGGDRSRNPFGCEAPSRDRVRFNFVGLDLGASYRLPTERSAEIYLGATVGRNRPSFEVHARYNGFLDRTRLVTRGTLVSLAAGVRGANGKRLTWA